MIDMLRKLGLSELEARCYLTLHDDAEHLSGYEVAKRVSVSRTNVYAALRALTDKGVVRMIEGDPVLYDAVPIKQVIAYLRAEFDQTADVLVQELKAPLAAPSFYNWQGQQNVKAALTRLIVNAKESIIVDIWAEDLHWVEDALIEAEARGIAVILITLGEVHTPLKHVHTHKRMEQIHAPVMRKFTVLCDCAEAIMGGFGGAVKLTALESNHPAIIETLKNACYHDLVMMQVEQDFGTQLEEAYGQDYEKIIAPLLHTWMK
ncbi:TrmB family transcriptional regulator [Brevibacillus migulae]|uniref:TrmB family transcriptional regulator n=1 Tax=Brevibacillus migulae TaxID=1644114 RepID=UPI00106DF9CA|nr:helix-turn-helix domain-containing protein [Brevibacillus migulae]